MSFSFSPIPLEEWMKWVFISIETGFILRRAFLREQDLEGY